MYEETLEEIREKDPNVGPLLDCKSLEQRFRILLGNFKSIYDIMSKKLGRSKKKKITFIDNK